MSNIIKNVKIDGLFGTTDINWDLNPSVNVLVGQNGSGKSTILRVIYSTLTQKAWGYNNIGECNIEVMNIGSFTFKIFCPTKERLLELDINPNTPLENFSMPMWSSITNAEINEASIAIEFISTINMSANSINHLTTSSGQETTLLDIEINNEINRLISFNDNGLKDKLVSALNALFIETDKIVEFENNKLIIQRTDGIKIDLAQLSSGERQIIFIFLKVVNASVDGALILMDEPEISLHLSWQEKLLNEIRRANDKSQIIIVTHSPAIIMKGWIDSFVDIKDISTPIADSSATEETA